MSAQFHSSGDLIADRRAGYAALLAESGDFAAAAELLAQALELAPSWPAGWDLLGGYYEKSGQIGAAVSAWRRVAELDADGIFGAELKLAAHGAARVPETTTTPYVEALFDDYAERFEEALVVKLGYHVPELLSDLVARACGAERIFARALDLGCGTGLMGERLRKRVSYLTGIDLSAQMIAETGRKGVYDELEKAELMAFLSAAPAGADLVTAADVFMYCGALPPIFAAVFRTLNPGGTFAFSVEVHEGEEDLHLRPSLRYAHSPAATHAALGAAGFEILDSQTATIRHDRGEPVSGLLVVARRPEPGAAEPVVAGLGSTPVAISALN